MVSIDDFNLLVKTVKEQSDTIALLREHLEEAGRKFVKLEEKVENEKKKEKESQKSKTRHINFGKELCPEAYDGKDATDFKHWRLKVANYMSNDEDDMTMDILEWAGKET
jgi:hypothetical protein